MPGSCVTSVTRFSPFASEPALDRTAVASFVLSSTASIPFPTTVTHSGGTRGNGSKFVRMLGSSSLLSTLAAGTRATGRPVAIRHRPKRKTPLFWASTRLLATSNASTAQPRITSTCLPSHKAAGDCRLPVILPNQDEELLLPLLLLLLLVVVMSCRLLTPTSPDAALVPSIS
eukprot:scaffold31_cov263-Pinguiococcus_pyrenoidosus.AAC.17